MSFVVIATIKQKYSTIIKSSTVPDRFTIQAADDLKFRLSSNHNNASVTLRFYKINMSSKYVRGK